MMFEYAEDIERLADIKVAGVGGAGGNAVGRMIEAGLTGVEFLAVNTDLQALKDSPAHNAMQIGAQLTKGLGSGGDPSRGHDAAEEDREALASALSGADMIFVTAGMGGGTGTGAAPVIADIARNQGALTVGIVTKPFAFEGSVRMAQAERGIEELKNAVDTLIMIPNQRLLEVVPPNTSMAEAFRIADNVLYEATRGIYEIISRHDHVNLDFADVRSVMKGMGEAMMGTGRAEGENRAVEAAKAAISSPLLENVDITGSKAVLVNVLGKEVGLQDTAAAMQYIQDAAGPNAHVIFGYGNDETMGDTLQVTVIATGFNAESMNRRPAARVVEQQVVEQEELVLEAEPEVTQEEIPEPAQEPLLESTPEPEIVPDPVMEAVEPAPAAEVAEAPVPEEETWDESPAAALCEEPAPPETPWSARPVTVDESVSTPVREPILEAEPTPAPEAFLTRAAAGGGADVDLPIPQAVQTEESEPNPFLRPVGTRSIGEVEVPETPVTPTPVSRSAAAGIGPENPGDDLNAPAYTRKYMD